MNEPCYYIPKQLITPEYAVFSVETKLLFGMILTNAKQTKSICEVADLIKNITEKDLKFMHDQIAHIEEDKDQRRA